MSTQTIERPIEAAAPDLEALFPGRYLSVTSFKRDGTGVATPVWFVGDGRQLFAFTDLHSAKVKRIRRNPMLLVAPCRPNGKLRGKPIPAHADVLTATPDLDRVQRLLRERYRFSYPVVMFFFRLARRVRGQSAIPEGAALAITLE